ncbi:hypothetical protein [Anabaena sp. 4-3]|nr:hypothetical protein [Anabaena sp. 4-3]
MLANDVIQYFDQLKLLRSLAEIAADILAWEAQKSGASKTVISNS